MKGFRGGDLARRLRGQSVELVVAVVLLAFALAVLLCNGYDWDVFLGFNEVDRRSWVLDLRPPLWSYQLCAGVTRIGDPQTFGLSPLFVLVLLFGSFWGSKLFVLASALVGLYFTTRLLALLASSDDAARVPRAASLTVATLFVTSNFFLWHLLVGHFTFTSFYFGLGIIYYTLKGYLRGLDRRDFAIGTLVTWQHFSGGFFHSTVYLLVPFFIAFALVAAAAGVVELFSAQPARHARWRRLAHAASFQVCGLLLASYKLLAVWRQQQAYPRTLPPRSEINDLGQLLAYQLVPTFGVDWPLPVESPQFYDLHELSAFSLLPLVLVVLGVRAFCARGGPSGGQGRLGGLRPGLGTFVALYAAISALLVLGEFSAYAPFTLLDATLFQGSVRAVPRFGVGLTLCLAMACALLMRRLPGPGLGPRACTVLLLLAMLDIATFSWMFEPARAVRLASLPAVTRPEMSSLVMVPTRRVVGGHELESGPLSETYPALLDGYGVINCYNALRRPQIGGWTLQSMVRLIDHRHGSPSPACIEQSTFTQNEVRIAEACPPFVCLNLSGLNDRDRPPGVRAFPRLQRLCRGLPPGARAPAQATP